jgi:sugar phosphate isomerase/epimerase
MPGKSLEANLDIGREAGFSGVETGVPADARERARFRSRLDDLGLDLVAQQWTTGADGAAHARSFEEQYRRSVEAKPLFVNSHTGRDIFPLSENLVVFERARTLEQQFGVPVRHETHRGRPTFCAPSTMALLDAAPGIMLTADFSHWCCVHESLLEDLGPHVSRAIAASRHAHVGWWQAIVDSRRKAGDAFLTVCPEFGPPDYQVTLPGTGKPISDLWEINRAMRDILRERLRV